MDAELVAMAFPELFGLGILRKVAAPWGRVDLNVAASGYSDSGDALGEHNCVVAVVEQTLAHRVSLRSGCKWPNLYMD